MTPREKTVIRAIIRALRDQGADDMDAYATSYPNGFVAEQIKPVKIKRRAAQLLEALVNA